MIKISQQQLELLESKVVDEFIYRVIDILKDDVPELIQEHSDNDLFSFLNKAMQEAHEYYIEVEQDVYDFMVFTLKYGLGFLAEKIFSEKAEWFESEYVPSVIKIKEIDTLYSKPEEVEEQNHA